MPTKTVNHGAVIAAKWTVLHSAVIKRSLTKTTRHGAKLVKARTVNHGAVIVDTRGTYRGVVSTAQRDALAKKYTGDTVIATDDANQEPQHQYTGAGWFTGSEQRLPEGAADHRVYFGGTVFFTNYTNAPDTPAEIQTSEQLGTSQSLLILGPEYASMTGNVPTIALQSTATTGTVTLSGDVISLDGGGVTVSGDLSVSGAFTADPIMTRLILHSTQRYEIRGAGELVIGTPTYTGSVKLGTPKVSYYSFTVPTDHFLEQLTRLTLVGGLRATLEGTADLWINDDFGARSRVVLAGGPT